MAASAAFEALASGLETAAGMDRWTSRGTLQLSLMDAGLEASTATGDQLKIVVDRLLPRQLQSHGIADVGSVCGRLQAALVPFLGTGADPGAAGVFARLAT
jgi:hypothetical protein